MDVTSDEDGQGSVGPVLDGDGQLPDSGVDEGSSFENIIEQIKKNYEAGRIFYIRRYNIPYETPKRDDGFDALIYAADALKARDKATAQDHSQD